MEALSVSEAGSEQFHDCNSQPTSPAPKAYPPAEVLVTEDLHREPSPVNGKDDPPVLSAGMIFCTSIVMSSHSDRCTFYIIN